MVGSRVAVGHHGVTRSALDAARRLADSGARGWRRHGDAWPSGSLPAERGSEPAEPVWVLEAGVHEQVSPILPAEVDRIAQSLGVACGAEQGSGLQPFWILTFGKGECLGYLAEESDRLVHLPWRVVTAHRADQSGAGAAHIGEDSMDSGLDARLGRRAQRWRGTDEVPDRPNTAVHDVRVTAAKRVWARVSSTMSREPVEWVLVSVAMLGFGLLLLVGGSTEVVGGLRDQAAGIHGAAEVNACNDLRVTRCEVTIVQPSAEARRVTVEPGRSLKPGTEVRVVILHGGEVEVIDGAFWAWGVGGAVGGVLLTWLGGWRLLNGRGSPEK